MNDNVSSHLTPLIRGRVAGAASGPETPRPPDPRKLPPAHSGGSPGKARPSERPSLASGPWAGLGVSPQWDMPGTPPLGGAQGASCTDARAT